MSESNEDQNRQILDVNDQPPEPGHQPKADAKRVQQILYHIVYEPGPDGKTETECFVEFPQQGNRFTIPYYKFWFATLTGEEFEIERVIKPFKDMVKKLNEMRKRFEEYTAKRVAEMKEKGELPDEETSPKEKQASEATQGPAAESESAT